MPGQDSAVHLHLNEKGHSFEDSEVQILAREDRWFERGVKEAIHVKLEKPSLNRGGGLRFNLSPVYDSVLGSLSRKLNTHSPLVPPSTNDPQGNRLSHSHLDSHSTNDLYEYSTNNHYEYRLGQCPSSGPNDSDTQSSHATLTTLQRHMSTPEYKACCSLPVDQN